MKILITILFTILAGVVAGLTYVYTGAFDAAADEPHSAPVHWLAETARKRSIAARAKGIEVPNLDDPKLIAEGASEYSEMCAGCHLAPGVADNEMRPGLYPPAPELAKQPRSSGDSSADAARQFWVVKHGIKMSAMPAWGVTHDDATIWSMVAFVRKLNTLSPAQYTELTQNAESAHEESGHGHVHATGDSD
jgi:mono/diheme cytochrome c family protein